MSRHKLRIKAMAAVYSYLVMERDIDELINDAFDDPASLIAEIAEARSEDGDDNEKETVAEAPDDESDIAYFRTVVRTSIENVERYKGYIDNVMKSWSFDRLGYLEKTVLLNGCAEFDMKQVGAAVIIDEAVRLAKTYCDPDSYRIINRILDII